jgi:short-subunit dehydrogenase
MSNRARSPIDGGVVLLTGASSGIGAALAEQLAPRAAVLVLVARRVDRLDALAARLRARHPTLVVDVQGVDLGEASAAAPLVAGCEARHGRLDVLINNAGMGQMGLFHEGDPDKLLQMLQINVVGLTLLTRAALPGMVQRGSGAVLMVSSGFGLTWTPLFAAYIGTKHHVTGFTEALRSELRGLGVRVGQLCPGPVATEFEAVAGNPTGEKVPPWVELSAEAAAAAGIAVIDGDRAMAVPGLVAHLAILSGRLSPRWLLRLLYGAMAPGLRARIAQAPK